MFAFFPVAFIHHLEKLGSSIIISSISHTIGSTHFLFIYSNWPHATFCSTHTHKHSHFKIIIYSDICFPFHYSAYRVHLACVHIVTKRMNAERRKKCLALNLKSSSSHFASEANHSNTDHLLSAFLFSFQSFLYLFIYFLLAVSSSPSRVPLFIELYEDTRGYDFWTKIAARCYILLLA